MLNDFQIIRFILNSYFDEHFFDGYLDSVIFILINYLVLIWISCLKMDDPLEFHLW